MITSARGRDQPRREAHHQAGSWRITAIADIGRTGWRDPTGGKGPERSEVAQRSTHQHVIARTNGTSTLNKLLPHASLVPTCDGAQQPADCVENGSTLVRRSRACWIA
jgi:hypothetical protein